MALSHGGPPSPGRVGELAAGRVLLGVIVALSSVALSRMGFWQRDSICRCWSCLTAKWVNISISEAGPDAVFGEGDRQVETFMRLSRSYCTSSVPSPAGVPSLDRPGLLSRLRTFLTV